MRKTQPPEAGTTRDGGLTLTPALRRSLRRRLLDWYDANGRDLPWRTKGARGDPYRVWLSEIMLQQTTVGTVIPYFQNFVHRWPALSALAAADLDDVLIAWQGLGYYARARNLHRCAQVLCAEHGGRFPADEAGLRSLPGIGPYTAAAIAAIAFDRPATVVDGNVERVMARLFAVEAPLPESKALLTRAAAGLTPRRRPGDYAQALMDLGATVCTPRAPDCGACPWRRGCRA
ncbi:MAG: A/G-specific adenine glycosylase [Proteobacteria bacterium]|nr:A/G-specific adenine glycosylase [Pseudomonadota bacterium]